MKPRIFIAPARVAALTVFTIVAIASAPLTGFEQPGDRLNQVANQPLALLGPISHSSLLDLDADDHLQYALLAGRAGGQILSGGSNSGDALALRGSTADDGDIILNALGGNVGIGTAAPSALLDVNGNANVAGNLTIGGTLDVPGGFTFTGDFTVNGTVFAHAVEGASPLELKTDTVTRIYIGDNTENGRIGIAMTAPNAETMVHIRDTVGDNFGVLVDSMGVSGSEIGLHVGPAQYGSLAKNAFFLAGWQRFNTADGAFLQEIEPDGDTFLYTVGPGANPIVWNTAVSLKASGNVGLGTIDPTSRLHVVGSAMFDGASHVTGDLTVDGDVLTHVVNATSPLELQTDGVTRVYIDDNGNNGHVGVGNPPPVPPAFPLDVHGDVHTDAQLRSSVPDGTAPLVVASMTLVTNLNADKLDGREEGEFALLAGRAGGQALNGGTNAGDPLTLNGSTTNDGDVLINPNGGNVGIMTATPGEKLDVVGGNIRTDSQFISTIADGTAPMVVTSMTVVTNFNADKLDGRHEDEFALLAGRPGGQTLNGGTNNNDPLTLNGSATNDGDVIINPSGGNVGIMTATPGEKLDVVGGNIRTDQQLISTIPDGTAPLVVDSMTVVTNLNADKVDGRHEDEFALLAGRPGGQTLHGGDAAGDDLVLDSTSDPMKGFVILNPTPVGPGTGSVGIGTMNPTEALEVIGCIKADCLKITAPNFVGISALGMVRAGSSVDVLAQVDGTAKVRALATGTHSTMIPVDMHTSLFGTQLKLAAVEIQYKLSTPNSFLAAVRARVMGNNGAFTNLAQSAATPPKATVWTTHTIMPAGGPVDITGPLYLNFEMNYTGTNSAHDIQIGKITLTIVQ